MRELRVKLLDKRASIPTRAHSSDAGLDIKCLDNFILLPKIPTKISTGLAFEIDSGFVGLVSDRSSMGSKGVTVLGGVIDAGYIGEVSVVLLNLANLPIKLEAGSKIAQMLILPISTPVAVSVDDLKGSSRGSGGFGSTGV